MTQRKPIVQIERTDERINITSPYNTKFVSDAHNLAGVFSYTTRAWSFDIRDEADVLEACYLAYGDDGYRYSICDVQISMPDGYSKWQGSIEFFGHVVAKATGRNSGAKISEGVKIISGSFDSGGSMKNWRTCAAEGTVIVLRDVSLPLVEAMMTEYENVEVEILNRTEILGDDRENLIAERDRLTARLAEINAILGD